MKGKGMRGMTAGKTAHHAVRPERSANSPNGISLIDCTTSQTPASIASVEAIISGIFCRHAHHL
jgi:hypothetical protein